MSDETFSAYMDKVFAQVPNEHDKCLPLNDTQIQWLREHNAPQDANGNYTFPPYISDEEIWTWLRILTT